MPSKLKLITQMYEESLHEIAKSPQDWVSFLKSATWNFGYNFSDKVCIYVQKPEARACATMEEWNRKAKRWINSNSKGIALIKEKDGIVGLSYVFDVSDTHQYNRKEYNLWEVKEEHTPYIIESLESTFGTLEMKDTLFNAICSAASIAVEDNMQDYLNDLKRYTTDSFLEELDDFNIETKLRVLLNNSVAFMMLERCNINPLDYFTLDDFRGIVDFNTYDTILRLGNATSDIAQMGIVEIKRTVKNLQNSEKNKNYTFERNNQIRYSNNINERGDDYGNNIYQTRGLSNTRLNTSSQRQGNSTWQIRNNEVELSERKQQGNVPSIANARQTNRTLTGDTRNSNKQNKSNNWTISRAGTDNRGIETERPNEVDRSYEQHTEQSRGNSDDGSDIQLDRTERQGWKYEIDNNIKNFYDDDTINEILKNAPSIKNKLEEIKDFLSKNIDNEEKCEAYISSSFSDAYTEYAINNNEDRVGHKTYKNGLLLWKGKYLSRTEECFRAWRTVTEHLTGMLMFRELEPVITNFPSENEQIDIIKQAEDEKSSVFSFPQEIIDKALQQGSHFEEGKFRIYSQLQKSLSVEENIKFLKQEYGVGGVSTIMAGTGIGENHDAKGIELYKGFGDNAPKLLLSWNKIEKRLKELIKLDRYLNTKEKEKYEEWQERQAKIEESNDTKEALLESEISEELQENDSIPPNEEYEYRIGDTIYIGADEFEILSLSDDNVRLYNPRFPLFNENMPFDEFDRKIKENPSNDHLKTINREPVPELITDSIQTENDDQVVEPKPTTPEIISIEQEELKPEFVRKRKEVREYDIHPEISIEDRNQYKIINTNLGVGTAKEKYRMNINAINVLKKCEEENRFATKEEQQIMSNYVGWGGLSDVFDNTNSSWNSEYNELRDLLSEKEYEQARASSLTSFYTPPVIIDSIYKAIQNMGFKEGNILEPSCGVGNFIGMLPDELKNSKVYGVEIDSITGRIARQLYQKSTIAVEGYEDTNLPDSFFDIAIGNVPFGNFKIADKRYDKNNFLIHDYFFAKTLDKVRPGGVIAFITSKGTLDKENPSVRKYIAQRADLIGAIRLPHNAFKNAGTKVTSDIIFLQKRDKITDIEPNWVYLDIDSNGIKVNKYFIDNPDMILGNMVEESGMYGKVANCEPYDNESLEVSLSRAINNINANITEYEFDDIEETDEDKSIPADYNVKNFSYTIVDGKVYYRVNSKMQLQELPVTSINRIKGLIGIRDCVRKLIELQTDDYPDEEIKQEQIKLNSLYDKFTKEYGLINNRANSNVFREDNSYYLLCSLEIVNENGELIRKADMFNKRTIKPRIEVTKVDTSIEALIVSMSEKAKVDIDYMVELTGKTKENIIKELEGSIYKVPSQNNDEIYVTAEEYLSGNIREKLKAAKLACENNPEYQANVNALEKAMPTELSASEINVKLGATWLSTEIITKFVFELLGTPKFAKQNIKVHYSEFTSEWNIEGKSWDKANIKANRTYGTERLNAYKIIEDTLNLKDVRVYDTIVENDGTKKRELNKKETAIAQMKQEQIKNIFQEWIWKDPDRRGIITKLYNEKFNSIRPREYDGSNLKFNGINPEITLRPHQANAIAHILYGGNTLLAHEVGAGKTFEMVAAAMESKRLGLCNKSLFVVPNHIIEQFASEFLQLYPSANILVTTKKDFATNNRKRFCSKIATGEYDAILMGHSQFEKIPMSAERQEEIINNQIYDIVRGIADLKANNGERYTIKALEKSKKKLEEKLKKLNDQSKKDDVITFEELGCDRLFVDEAHYFKNLYLYTKMRNVAGISQVEAQKSSDLFMKCRYLDELTGSKGVIFATGTPISNSMVELYTMQRYLQYNTLEKYNLQHFDAWASTFGETVTAIELDVMKILHQKKKIEYQKVA